MAVIANRDSDTVDEWIAGHDPGSGADQRIRDTLLIVELLTSVDAPSTVRGWFMGMNPLLDDVSPAEALQHGRVRDVVAAAQEFAAAG